MQYIVQNFSINLLRSMSDKNVGFLFMNKLTKIFQEKRKSSKNIRVR